MPQANIAHIRKFIEFAGKELKLPSLPHIKLVGSEENRYDAFGHSRGAIIVVRITDRHPIDIMRTLAHEMIHYKQTVLGQKSSEDFKEDQANLMAGRLMRKFDISNPDVFKDKAVRANMMLENFMGIGALGPAPVNSTGPGIANYDPLMFKRRKRGDVQTNILQRKAPTSLRQLVKPNDK